MDQSILTIIGTAVALAAFFYTCFHNLRKDMVDGHNKLSQRIDEQGREQAKFREDMAGRMGKLEGLLEGLREAITGKRAA